MRQSTTPTAPDAVTISSAADIIQEPPTLDSPGTISATPADAGQVDSTPADQQQESPGRRTRRKSTTSAAVKRRYNAAAYDNLQINIAKGGKQAIQTAAAAAGLSTAAYITAAVNAYAGHEIVPPLAVNPYI